MLTYGSAAYTYRADGLRASDGTGSSKKYYLYDGGNAICRLDSTGNLDRTYVFAPDGLVGWSIPGSGSHQMLFDWQGNLEHSTSATGSVATSHAYNAWGQRNSVFPINAVTGANDRFGYNARWGYVRDTTGLYYCQNRYYDPANGRWLNRDPIGYAGGMNLYGYCGGGPVGAADPSGLLTWEDVGAGLATSAVALGHAILSSADGAINFTPNGAIHYLLHGRLPSNMALLTEPYMDRPGARVSAAMWSVAGMCLSLTGSVASSARTSTVSTLPPKVVKEFDDLGGIVAAPPSARGKAPIGTDGHPVELHHPGQVPGEPVPMTRTEHRLGDNFSKNHTNTGAEPSRIDRGTASRYRKKIWSDWWDNNVGSP